MRFFELRKNKKANESFGHSRHFLSLDKKAIAWDVMGKIILVLIVLTVILIIMGLILNKSFGLIETIKTIFGG